MKPEDFDLFATLVKQRSGLMLTREKAYLLESRLLPVARKYNLRTLEEMAQSVRSERDEAMMSAITDAMTTNELSFFRDLKPFKAFRETLLPQLMEARANKRHVRIWSAAASSGQEAYSLAMICAEEQEKLQGWKIDIVGTDISKEMVERSKSGIYSQFEIQHGLPIRMLLKYFQQAGTDKWQIKEELRQMVQFNEGNLLHDFGPIGIFDIVYCRNVLMYLDTPTQRRVLDAIYAVMAPGGILLIGNSEEPNIGLNFEPMSGQRGMYVCAAQGAGGIKRTAG